MGFTRRRFSKKTLSDHVNLRMNYIQANNCFDSGNGSAQVENKSPKANRDYGAYDALRSLMDEFELWDIE